MNPLRAVREACARVAGSARHVHIDDDRLAALAALLADATSGEPIYDPAHHHLGDRDSTLAFVLSLDAVNFGSGWFPQLVKRPGCSGYLTIAGHLKDRFERRGPWSAAALRKLTAEDCAGVFGQREAAPEIGELMALFARSLGDLGEFLEERYDGCFMGPVEDAGGSAARLVGRLTEMPLYRDVARYGGAPVPFYKRAQITAADLAMAFHGAGPGRFDDLGALTIFADNLVPHVLRVEGVLRYDEALAARIDAGLLLAAGCEEEVEIRACAVHAVECCVAWARAQGYGLDARQLDHALWTRGQDPGIKSRPRHRTRTPYY